MNARICSLGIVLMFLSLTGCSTRTHITSVWMQDDYTGPPMRSLMILAETGDEYNRVAWENIISQRFRRSRMNAVPASSAFPEDKSPAINQVIDHARAKGIDGVLVIRHVDTETEETHYPETRTYYYPRPSYYYDYWPDRRHYYPHRHGYDPYYHEHFYRPYYYAPPEVVVTPGYTVEDKVVVIGTYLYRASTGDLAWNMSSDTYNPGTESYLVADICRRIFYTLREYRLIALTW